MSGEVIFYVYVLMDPRHPGPCIYSYCGRNISFPFLPIYVGKGRGNRMKHHTQQALRETKHTRKLDKLRKIHASGHRVIELQVSDYCSNDVALRKETLLIKAIGRLDLKKGPLTNNTDGGEGVAGYRHTDEAKDKMRAYRTGKKTPHSDATRAKISAGNKGKVISAYQRMRVSLAKTGSVTSAAVRAKISQALTGAPKSAEHRLALSGPKHTAASRALISAAQRAIPKKVMKCPHCGKVGKGGIMHRWHFDNCSYSR